MRRLVVLMAVCCTAARADTVTSTRVDGLAGSARAAWQAYLDRSREAAAADQRALTDELASEGLPSATKAPSGGDFKLPEDKNRDWYLGGEGQALIDAVRSYQTASGGWSKHTGYGKGPRLRGMQWSSQYDPGKPSHYVATFDNGATTKEITFLADAWLATSRADCQDGVRRGIDFILAAQFPSGGWPQVYPLEGGYHDNITLNDDAMTNVLSLLQAVSSGEPRYACVDDARRKHCAEALDRGIACAIAAQVVIDGTATAWCAQHDPITLEPAPARAFEPAALSGVESAHLLRFLMSLDRPSPDVVACIEHGLAWLDQAQVTGLAKVKRDGRTTYVADPSSEAVYWARFYDLASGKPMFPGKDGIVYPTYEAMASANSKLGYDYLSTLPGSILRNGQKKWRKRLKEPD